MPSVVIVKEKKVAGTLAFCNEIRLQQVTYYPNTTTPVIADLDLVIKRNTYCWSVRPNGKDHPG